MRRLISFLLATGLFWTGCAGNAGLGTNATAQTNVENLARIHVGMADTQVFRIMRKPYKNEKIQIDEDRYEVWFYVTKPTLMDQSRMVHYNLTPLTFKNGILQSTGYDYYDAVVKKKAISTKLGQTKPETEDLQLEKTLQTPQSPTQPPAQPTPKKGGTAPSQPQPTPPPAAPPSGQGATKPKPSNQPAGQKNGQDTPATKGNVSRAILENSPSSYFAALLRISSTTECTPHGDAEKLTQNHRFFSASRFANCLSMYKKVAPADNPPEKPPQGGSGPVQPQAVQPPPPVQPPSPVDPLAPPPPPEKGGKKPAAVPPKKADVSMSKKPPPAENPSEKPAEPDKKKVPLTEKDQQMIDQEEEENFDFW